jgi:hypothetical protein
MWRMQTGPTHTGGTDHNCGRWLAFGPLQSNNRAAGTGSGMLNTVCCWSALVTCSGTLLQNTPCMGCTGGWMSVWLLSTRTGPLNTAAGPGMCDPTCLLPERPRTRSGGRTRRDRGSHDWTFPCNCARQTGIYCRRHILGTSDLRSPFVVQQKMRWATDRSQGTVYTPDLLLASVGWTRTRAPPHRAGGRHTSGPTRLLERQFHTVKWCTGAVLGTRDPWSVCWATPRTLRAERIHPARHTASQPRKHAHVHNPTHTHTHKSRTC